MKLVPRRFYSMMIALAMVVGVMSHSTAVYAEDYEPFFPKSTDIIVNLNVRSLLDSDLTKKYALDMIKDVLKKDEAKAVFSLMNLDPLKDVEALHSGMSIDANDPLATVLLKGKFDMDKINAALVAGASKSKDYTIEKINGKTGFKFDVKNSPKPMYGAVLDSNWIFLATEKKDVEAAMDALTKKSTAISKELSALVGKLDSKMSFSMVAYTKGKLDKLPIPSGNVDTKAIEDIDSLSMQLLITSGVKFNFVMGMSKESAAKDMNKKIVEGLDQVSKIAPLMIPEKSQVKMIQDILGAISSSAEDKSVTIKAEVKGDQIQKIVEAVAATTGKK